MELQHLSCRRSGDRRSGSSGGSIAQPVDTDGGSGSKGFVPGSQHFRKPAPLCSHRRRLAAGGRAPGHSARCPTDASVGGACHVSVSRIATTRALVRDGLRVQLDQPVTCRSWARRLTASKAVDLANSELAGRPGHGHYGCPASMASRPPGDRGSPITAAVRVLILTHLRRRRTGLRRSRRRRQRVPPEGRDSRGDRTGHPGSGVRRSP